MWKPQQTGSQESSRPSSRFPHSLPSPASGRHPPHSRLGPAWTTTVSSNYQSSPKIPGQVCREGMSGTKECEQQCWVKHHLVASFDVRCFLVCWVIWLLLKSEPLQLVTWTTLPAKETDLYWSFWSFTKFKRFCLIYIHGNTKATWLHSGQYCFRIIKDDIALKSLCWPICTITVGTMTFNNRGCIEIAHKQIECFRCIHLVIII